MSPKKNPTTKTLKIVRKLLARTSTSVCRVTAAVCLPSLAYATSVRCAPTLICATRATLFMIMLSSTTSLLCTIPTPSWCVLSTNLCRSKRTCTRVFHATVAVPVPLSAFATSVLSATTTTCASSARPRMTTMPTILC
eukprot:Amastigsp_a687927_2.p2 type:complete len:138 gc:universal Amastigsp_a687927_2:141-554(+)